MGAALQHDPTQAKSPDLPQEILSKISTITKMLDMDASAELPKPEKDCNCFHCQIARAISSGSNSNDEEKEEEVSDEELKFREWDIVSSGDKLYTVTNPLDNAEQYSVYLGDPVGCTCGNPKCEHIKAVLST